MVSEKIQWQSFLPSIPLSQKQGVSSPLFIVKPYWANPATLQVRADQPVTQNDQQWICLSWPCSSEPVLTGLTFHYTIQDAHNATAIRSVQLSEVREPLQNPPTRIISEQTNLRSSSPAVYRKMFNPRKVNGALVLQLQVEIGGSGSSAGVLYLGGAGIIYT